MFVLGNFIAALAAVLDFLLTAVMWLVIIRAALSWVNPDPFNPIVQFLTKTTEPILAPFRRILPMHNVGFDLSPLFAIVLIMFARMFIVRTLADIALRTR